MFNSTNSKLITSLSNLKAGRYSLELFSNPANLLFYIDPVESWTFSSVENYKGYQVWPFIVGFGLALVLAFVVVVYTKKSKDKTKVVQSEWVPLDTVEWE